MGSESEPSTSRSAASQTVMSNTGDVPELARDATHAGAHFESNTSQEPTSLPAPHSESRTEQNERERAAIAMQKAWRSRRPNTDSAPGGHKDDAKNKWHEMNVEMRTQVNRTAAEDAKNDPKTRWKRAEFLASRLQAGDALKSEDPTLANDAGAKSSIKGALQTKILETQHWLELIDGKHRYGMKFYFRRWVDADTEENFFFWLDRGGGKDLDLEECPREQLEGERITYLSSEQRKNYLVKIDPQGRLRWARNDVLVDTRADRWKDTEGGMGIVPVDGTEDRAVEHRLRRKVSTLSGGPSESSVSSVDSLQDAQHYSGNPTHGPIKRAFASRFTSKGITDRLLKKTVKKNTWIYAADAKFNLFVGIKSTGTFQHSSLTGGGLITSAGLIKVKDGQIQSLSPLSGHYRTSIDHFKGFLEVLEERGADLHKVQRTKAEIALWALSRWKTFKKSQAAFISDRKDDIEHALHPGATSHRTADGSRVADPPAKEREDPNHDSAQQAKASQADSGGDEDSSWLPESWRLDVLKGRRKLNAMTESSSSKAERAEAASGSDDPGFAHGEIGEMSHTPADESHQVHTSTPQRVD